MRLILMCIALLSVPLAAQAATPPPAPQVEHQHQLHDAAAVSAGFEQLAPQQVAPQSTRPAMGHNEEQSMHYKNGREAKNGDKVVLIPSYGAPTIGILYDAVPGNDHCNGKIAPISNSDPCPDLKECLHLDDVLKALPAEVPDTSRQG